MSNAHIRAAGLMEPEFWGALVERVEERHGVEAAASGDSSPRAFCFKGAGKPVSGGEQGPPGGLCLHNLTGGVTTGLELMEIMQPQ